MIVKATWEFDFDTEGLYEEYIDIEGLAKDSTKRELKYLLEHNQISEDDFSYEIVSDDDLSKAYDALIVEKEKCKEAILSIIMRDEVTDKQKIIQEKVSNISAIDFTLNAIKNRGYDKK